MTKFFFIHNHMPSALFDSQESAEDAAQFHKNPDNCIQFYRVTLKSSGQFVIVFVGKWHKDN